MPKDPVLVARAKLAIATRHGNPTAALKQELNYVNLVRMIEKAEEGVGLTDAQKRKLIGRLSK